MFGLLGPVQVRRDTGWTDLGSGQLRTVWAVLLANAGRPVTLGTLVDCVWEDTAPAGARRVIYTYANRIRRQLAALPACAANGPAGLRRGATGYLLDVDPDQIDRCRFTRLLAAGRATAREPERVALLGQALDLWRGTALAGIEARWAATTRDAWHRQRLDAAIGWAEASLRLGRHEHVLGRLRDLVVEHPLAEPLAGTLMRTLAATGRNAEALDQYTLTRSRLAEMLGTEPSAELQALHQAILRGEQAGGSWAGAAPAVTTTPRLPAPAQLPVDVPGFAGRGDQLSRLDALCSGDAGGDRPGLAVVTISGTAGVGKTALAVHWAHRVRHRFPDGQLYRNLRGFDKAGAVSEPADVLYGFLTALGVPADSLPAGTEPLAALFRTVVSDRRLLVLLDNARDADQVRPLLPATPGCVAIVTSRDQLTPLMITEGARPLALDLLDDDEACQLLVRRVGRERLLAEPAALGRILSACSGLPLALTITAARAVLYPTFPLAAVAADMTAAGGRLDALTVTGADDGLRAVFSWSYAALEPAPARLFRLLGLHPSTDVTVAAAASLVGGTPEGARAQLAALARASLVAELRPGRFVLHDLLREYAAELAAAEEPDGERTDAVVRLCDYYLAATLAAIAALYPGLTDRPTVASPAAAIVPELTVEAARDWLEVELPTLVAVTETAVDAGQPRHAVDLAAALSRHLIGGRPFYALAIHKAAARAARRCDDPAAEARALHGLGTALMDLGDYRRACDDLERALALHRRTGDLTGQARALANLGILWKRTGDYDRASDCCRQALDRYRQVGNHAGEARTLTSLGAIEWGRGGAESAVEFLTRALTIHRDIGDLDGEAYALTNLGRVEHDLGRYEQAFAHHGRALTTFRRLGNRDGESAVLDHLGSVSLAAGRVDAAIDYYRRCLDVVRLTGDPGAEASALNGLASATAVRDGPAAAGALFSEALLLAERIGSGEERARAQAGLDAAARAAAGRC